MEANLSRRLRWLGIEFVVIVLGVLSALFVDTWVEESENAKRADIYRQRLAVDMERDIVNMNAVIGYYRSVREHGLSTLEALEGARPLDDFSLMFAAFNAAEEWAFILESSTYNDLQSTGGLALIGDVQLRIDLADYYRIGRSRENVWSLPRDFRAEVRGIIPNDLQAAIHTYCVPDREFSDLLSAEDVTGTGLSAAVEPLTGAAHARDFCGLQASDFDVARAAAELRSDPAIPRLLRYRISQLRVAITLFEGQRELASEVRQKLQAFN